MLYVHWQSNHPPPPPGLLKNIPENINKRLASISSSKDIFDQAIPPYQRPLMKADTITNYRTTTLQSKQPVTKGIGEGTLHGITPPWNSNVKTNLGKKFLSIVDKCFPKNHPLNKIFNRHTLKLSYSCMPNMKTIIASHSKQILSNASTTPNQTPDSFNCRKKAECPLEGKCLQDHMVYQATVTTQTTTESYVELATNFKERYRNHNTSFRNTNRTI